MPDEAPHWNDFKAIAASVKMACTRAIKARLAGDQLRTVGLLARNLPRIDIPIYAELRDELLNIDEDGIHSLGRELRRSNLTTAIGILDFCLFEVLVFMLDRFPGTLIKLPQGLTKKRRTEETNLEFAERLLERTGIMRRIEIARAILDVRIEESLIEEFKPLHEKRHEVVHQSKFFESALIGERQMIRIRPFPEVTNDDALMAIVSITEISDSILEHVAYKFFGATLGDLRPLTPALKEIYAERRRSIQERRERGPEIEVINDPEWTRPTQ